MIQVIVGTEENQFVTERVLWCSIRAHTSRQVEVRFVRQEEGRVGGTNFGFVRFHVPQLCGYQGRAIYLDADQLVRADIGELADSLDDRHAIALVNEPQGFFGDKPVGKHNQTSVMVMDCAKLRHWDPATMFRNVVPNRAQLEDGQIHYRDYMMLAWEDPALIQPLDPRWNHFNVIEDDTKLVHFSHVRTQPWKAPAHPLTGAWSKWLVRAMHERFLKRRQLAAEVLRRHIHPHFLRYVFN